MDADQKKMYKLMAQVITAAGHEIRLAILDYLKEGEQCVCHIAEHVGAKRSNVSRHLSVMYNAGLVGQRKDGLKTMYYIRARCILNITRCAAGVLKERAKETSEILGNLR